MTAPFALTSCAIILPLLPKLIILDADGVLWRGSQALPHAADFIRRAHHAGIRCCLMSNNAAPSRSDYAAKCRRLDLALKEADIFSVNYIAGPYLARSQPGKSVLVLGSPQLYSSVATVCPAQSAAGWLKEHGLGEGAVQLSDLSQLSTAAFDAVLVGIDFDMSYLKLALACAVLQRGAVLFGTNEDLTFPFEGGLLMPGNGSFVELLSRVSGRQAEYIGKPNLHMLEQIELECGIARSEMMMVGDRIDTDIMLARRAGMAACLVLTGVTAPEAAPPADDMLRIAADLSELAEQLHI